MIANRLSDAIVEEKKIEHNYVSISPLDRPKKSKPNELFTDREPLPRTTFHQVYKVVEKHDTELRVFYIKENPPGSIISELEAACAGFYRLLAPHHVPASYAVYDKTNTYIGVASEEIPGFKSTVEDTLTDADLHVDFMEKKNISIDLMEELDNELRELDDAAEHVDKRLKKLEKNEVDINAELKALRADVNGTKARYDKVFKDYETNSFAKINATNASCDTGCKIAEFYQKIEAKHKITKKELENYRVVKGLAHCLTTSYIFMEDDLHQNNLSKFGKRIDFDMSLWPILYDYKDSLLIYFRRPVENAFKVTTRDIDQFPNLKDATPFYWPTNPAQVFSDNFSTTVKMRLHLSTNAYPHQANVLYQKLEKNPVFIYHKFAILSKYILTDAEIYKNITQSHVREECMYRSKSFIDVFAKQQADRIAECENALVNLPKFAAFFKAHNEKIKAQLAKDLTDQGIPFDAKQIEEGCTNILDLIQVSIKKAELKSAEDLLAKPKTELIEAKPVRLVPINLSLSYEEIRTAVIASMTEYQNPGFFAFGGKLRSHPGIAIDLIKFAKGLNPNSSDKEDEAKAIVAMKKRIREDLAKVDMTKGGITGEMHKLLMGLLGTINNAQLVKQVPGLGL